MEKNNELTEDDLRRDEKEVQKIVDKHTKTVDEMIKEKENEIMGV